MLNPLPFLTLALLMVSLISIMETVSARQNGGQHFAVRTFADQVEREWPGDAAQQAITAESLMLFAAAVQGVATTRDVPVTAQLDTLQKQIATFAGDRANAAAQPQRLQYAFRIATDLLARLAGTPTEEMRRRLEAMRRSADSLDLKMPLRRQPDVIERFLHQAAEVLRALDDRS